MLLVDRRNTRAHTHSDIRYASIISADKKLLPKEKKDCLPFTLTLGHNTVQTIKVTRDQRQRRSMGRLQQHYWVLSDVTAQPTQLIRPISRTQFKVKPWKAVVIATNSENCTFCNWNIRCKLIAKELHNFRSPREQRETPHSAFLYRQLGFLFPG